MHRGPKGYLLTYSDRASTANTRMTRRHNSDATPPFPLACKAQVLLVVAGWGPLGPHPGINLSSCITYGADSSMMALRGLPLRLAESLTRPSRHVYIGEHRKSSHAVGTLPVITAPADPGRPGPRRRPSSNVSGPWPLRRARQQPGRPDRHPDLVDVRRQRQLLVGDILMPLLRPATSTETDTPEARAPSAVRTSDRTAGASVLYEAGGRSGMRATRCSSPWGLKVGRAVLHRRTGVSRARRSPARAWVAAVAASSSVSSASVVLPS